MKYYFTKPYRPISQLPFCCVPATLQWILYRHNLDILDQETIGVKLGLRLPERFKKIFKNNGIIFIDNIPKTGYGTQIQKKRYSISNFLKNDNIPLKISELITIANRSELNDFLIKNISQDNDIILRYNNMITRQDGKKSHGHFSVIAEYDTRTKQSLIGDPEIPFFKKSTLEQLLYATSDKIDGIQRGFYIVSILGTPISLKNEYLINSICKRFNQTL